MNKTIVVLGANSDIGRAIIVAAAADEDCRVIGVSRSAAIAPADDPENVFRIGAIDLTVEADLNKLREQLITAIDGPFSAIHAVGDFWRHRPFFSTTLSESKRMIDSHVVTLCGAAALLLPLMVERGGGRLVAFSCNSVRYAYPDMAPFTASKAAVEALVRAWANELSGKGVMTVALALPTVLTAKVLSTKPLTGSSSAYLDPATLAGTITETVLQLPITMSGNVVSMFRHNDTFFRTSYYERNPLDSGTSS